LQFLGQEAPPSRCLPGASRQDSESLPLASKDVAGSVDIDATIALAHHAELRQHTRDTCRYIRDSDLLQAILATDPTLNRSRRNARCTLVDTDIEIQLGLRKYERIDRAAEIAAWCRVFSVPQPAKRNRRHICEPLINDHFGSTPTIRAPLAAARAAVINRHSWGAQLDFASWFDQIPLSPSVRRFFGVRSRNDLFRMTVMPMGFRPSAAIGQALTWCIADVPPTALAAGTTIITYLDNILILGPSAAAVCELTELIIRRAVSVGAQFSEGLSHLPPEAQVATEIGKAEHQPTQSFDFLGMHYDLKTKTVRQAAKTAKKIADIRNLFENAASTSTDITCTARELAAMFGLALFASSACATRSHLPSFRPAFQFFRHVASSAATGNWDQIIHLRGSAFSSFKSWFAELAANPPTSIIPETVKEKREVLFVDASEAGWGAVHLRDGGLVEVVAARWSASDHASHNLASSVSAEPLAIARALARCITPLASEGVVVYTDHMPVVAACASPCAKGYAYWQLQQFLLRFPTCVEIRWIPGTKNPADAGSRGESSNGEAWLAVYEDALRHHSLASATLEDRRVAEDGEYGQEWLCTARNPNRQLSCTEGRLVRR
jgi:hypothetical protein